MRETNDSLSSPFSHFKERRRAGLSAGDSAADLCLLMNYYCKNVDCSGLLPFLPDSSSCCVLSVSGCRDARLLLHVSAAVQCNRVEAGVE